MQAFALRETRIQNQVGRLFDLVYVVLSAPVNPPLSSSKFFLEPDESIDEENYTARYWGLLINSAAYMAFQLRALLAKSRIEREQKPPSRYRLNVSINFNAPIQYADRLSTNAQPA